MRTVLVDRVLPFLAAFLVNLVFNVAAMALVFGRGFGFALSLPGLALQALLTVGLAAGFAAALRWTKGARPASLGLRSDRRALGELVLGGVGGFVGFALLLAVLWAAGQVELRSVPGGGPSAAVGIAACAVNAAFQQLGLQVLGVAGSGPNGRSIVAFALSAALFLAAHAGGSPLYLVNVGLFAAVTIALFRPGPSPSLAAPTGFHGGWNAAMVGLGALPESDVPGLFAVTATHSAWTGGPAGVESGAAYTVAISLVFVGVSVRAWRSSS